MAIPRRAGKGTGGAGMQVTTGALVEQEDGEPSPAQKHPPLAVRQPSSLQRCSEVQGTHWQQLCLEGNFKGV